MRLITILGIVAFSWVTNLQATSPVRPYSIRIDSAKFTTLGIPPLQDTIPFRVWLTPTVSGTCNVHLSFPGTIVPLDVDIEETERDTLISVDSGVSVMLLFDMQSTAFGSSFFSVSAIHDSIALGNSRKSSWYKEITHTAGAFTLHDMSSTNSDTASLTAYSMPPPYTSSFSVSGKVNYQDVLEVHDGKYVRRGVPGVKVYLFFHEGEWVNGRWEILGGWSNMIHPVSGCASGVHYSNVDMEGRYSFSFPTKTTAPMLNAILMVTRSNEAVEVLSGDKETVTGGSCDDHEFFPKAYITTIRMVPGDFQVSMQNIDILLEATAGGILRGCLLSRQFADAQDVGVVPTQIDAYVVEPDGEIAGKFYPTSREIHITQGFPELPIVGHEYGHYVTQELWNYHSADLDFEELTAEFYQFCVRNYAQQLYGDRGDWEDGNLEEAPTWKYDQRFWGVAYLRDFPLRSRGACLLWNLYDGPALGGFFSDDYLGHDNDDIVEPQLVFETFEALGSWNSEFDLFDFLDEFNSQLYASEIVAVDRIQECMMTTGPTYPPMGSPQVKEASGTAVISGNCRTVTLNWEYQNYESPTFWSNHQNLPDGVAIYASGGPDVWNYVTQVDYPDQEIQFYSCSASNLYRVTAYIGEELSYAPVDISPVVLKQGANLSHPSALGSLEISPNPAGNRISVNIPSVLPDAVALLRIFSPTGACLISREVSGSGRTQLDVSSLASGPYSIVVLLGNTRLVEQIIISR